MSEKEITEGNKLIAEFMGGMQVNWFLPNKVILLLHEHCKHLGFPKIINKQNYTTWATGYEVSELQYHSDWNWLIPALNKAYDIIKDTERMSWRTRLFNVLNTFLQRGYDNEGNVTETYNIERAFKHLVLFIKDYEEYKHEQTIL